ncbi:MAG TPA: class I SAM-dependent methyltransferase, partial [Flavilitoribacter sp.]|nr:class I SAM-dependent methyltransferase [Flavilitoribacter sp.]
PPILEKILAEMWRVLQPGGMMSHFIDMSDHFAHMDPSITIYNYLQYSERAWGIIDNTIQPQNRWRLPQYRTLYRALEIPYAEEKLRPGDVDAVRAMKLAPPYDAMPAEEVAISHGYMVSWKDVRN